MPAVEDHAAEVVQLAADQIEVAELDEFAEAARAVNARLSSTS